MPSPRTLLSLSLSSISVVLATGCPSDDECGPGNAADTIIASEADTVLTYGNLESLAGRDCQVPDAPEGVIAITIAGDQTDEGQTGRLTLCIPRPDTLMEGNKTIGTALSSADIRIIDFKGTTADGCSYKFDPTRLPTGTGDGQGVCNNAVDPAGFALVLDAKASLERTCGTTVDTIGIVLAGTVKITHRDE